MVDPVSGGNTPRLQNISRTVQELEENTRAEERSSAQSAGDIVDISDEAISLQQAESTAQETRQLVQESGQGLARNSDALNIFT